MADLVYAIRRMTRDDVPAAMDLWHETEFQQGTHSFYTWLEVDKDAFNVAVKDTGEIIGICSAVVHHEDLAYVGLYAVRKEYQRRGIGKKLWVACLEHVGTRNGMLCAVPDKTDLYRTEGGFPILETAWQAVINLTYNPVDHGVLSNSPSDGVDILPFEESHLPAMLKYDRALMGYSRQTALELNCKETDSRTFVAFHREKCVGLGTIRMSNHRLGQVGPLYADDPKVAEVLLKRLIASQPNAKGLAMMTISSNLHAKELIDKLGCSTIVECPWLYSKSRFVVDTTKVFASFDLSFSPF